MRHHAGHRAALARTGAGERRRFAQNARGLHAGRRQHRGAGAGNDGRLLAAIQLNDGAAAAGRRPRPGGKGQAAGQPAYNKTVAAKARILPETSKLATALEVVELLVQFVSEKHPKQLGALAEVLEPFGAVVEKRFG